MWKKRDINIDGGLAVLHWCERRYFAFTWNFEMTVGIIFAVLSQSISSLHRSVWRGGFGCAKRSARRPMRDDVFISVGRFENLKLLADDSIQPRCCRSAHSRSIFGSELCR